MDNNELNQKYLTILNRIKAENNEFVQWMNEPFSTSKGKTVATNGFALVITPQCGDFPILDGKMESVYPEKNCDYLIPRSLLTEKLSCFPTTDCYDEEEQECGACYGSGDVDYEFEYGGKTYELNGECPVCEGEQVTLQTSTLPNGKRKWDNSKHFGIGISAFKLDRIEELLFVADTLESDIRLVCQTRENGSSLFAIGDVELLLMPIAEYDFDTVEQSIIFPQLKPKE